MELFHPTLYLLFHPLDLTIAMATGAVAKGAQGLMLAVLVVPIKLGMASEPMPVRLDRRLNIVIGHVLEALQDPDQ